jgi:hypothetical protein
VASPSVRLGQGGGALLHEIKETTNNLPRILSLQGIWEEMSKQYKQLEPEYQRLLPEPGPAPLESLKDPFHRYMDEFGDHDILEEARDTIGLMPSDKVEELFTQDDSPLIDLYQKAMPEVDRDLIPNFIRADILRILL